MALQIKKLNYKIPVYDITVEKTENFFANNILVHNCAEITLYSSPTEQAVCNLASIALPKYIENGTFNHQSLYDSVYQVTKNLNNVIDLNYYPTEETRYSNFKHRPIGIGIQGLADVFCLLGLSFESKESDKLQTEIVETMYFAALTSSKDLAKINGAYESYVGSPIEQGIFQYELWDKKDEDLSGRWDWKKLREEIKEHGIYNSTLLAKMPTASCLVSDSYIKTVDGNMSYQEIMDVRDIDWKEIEKTNEQIWITFDTPLFVETRNGQQKTDKIFYNGHVETLAIEMEDGTLFKCSLNHKFLVNRNGEEVWVEAKDLVENDDIVEKNK